MQSSENNQSDIEETIKIAILDHYGVEESVLVKTRQDLKRVFDDSPVQNEKYKLSYFIMLYNTPTDDLVKSASEKVYEGEEYQIIKN